MDRYKRYTPCAMRQNVRRCDGVMPRNGEYCVCTNQPVSLAMAYIPTQEFRDVYTPCQALENGTIFSELVMPFCSGGCRR